MLLLVLVFFVQQEGHLSVLRMLCSCILNFLPALVDKLGTGKELSLH